jgi:uncharacterized membrane protein YhaH (DUF805 family)
MNWYLVPWQKYADFDGRARRKEYWTFSLINFVIYMVLWLGGGGLAMSMGRESGGGVGALLILYFLFALASFVPGLAVSVRRLHDIGKSGWWILIAFIPLAGIVLLVFMFMDSQPGANEYGPNPKELPAGTPALG